MPIFSALFGARAADKAGEAQEQAAQAAIEEQRRQFDLSRSDLAPYRETGNTALGELAALYGIGRNGLLPLTAAEAASAPAPVAAPAPVTAPPVAAPSLLPARQAAETDPAFRDWFRRQGYQDWQVFGTGSGEGGSPPVAGLLDQLYSTYRGTLPTAASAGGAAAPAAPVNALAPGNSNSVEAARARFTTSPGYEFRLGEGLKAVERSAAARGLLGSGGTVKAVQRFGEGLASNEFENYANRLASLAGIGQNATNTGVAAGQHTADAVSNALADQGAARASSYIGGFNALQQGIGNGLRLAGAAYGPFGFMR